MMRFTPESQKEFEWLLTRYPTRQAALLPTLRLVERDFGSVSEEGVRLAARLLDIPPARVMGVLSFYTHYRRPGDGRYVIHVCCTLPCALRGCRGLLDGLTRRLGIGVDQTTPDGRFTIRKAECLAACDRAPMMTINDAAYGPLTSEGAGEILSALP